MRIFSQLTECKSKDFYQLSITKKFLKVNRYKNRSNYSDKELKDYLVVNTGKIGAQAFRGSDNLPILLTEEEKDKYLKNINDVVISFISA